MGKSHSWLTISLEESECVEQESKLCSLMNFEAQTIDVFT